MKNQRIVTEIGVREEGVCEVYGKGKKCLPFTTPAKCPSWLPPKSCMFYISFPTSLDTYSTQTNILFLLGMGNGPRIQAPTINNMKSCWRGLKRGEMEVAVMATHESNSGVSQWMRKGYRLVFAPVGRSSSQWTRQILCNCDFFFRSPFFSFSKPGIFQVIIPLLLQFFLIFSKIFP